MTPRPEGGCTLVYQVWAVPKNLLGRLFLPVQIGVLSARSFDAAVRQYDRLLVEKGSLSDSIGPVTFAPAGRERLAALHKALLAEGAPAGLVTRLVQLLDQADDLTLARLRPYALADYWGVARRDTLELFLLAAHLGLLEPRWDVMCPLCRVPKASTAALGELRAATHCETCNIDFAANFDQSVELTFRPHPSVRRADAQMYCLAGPQMTPHVVAQQILPSQETRAFTLPLEEGRYRVRSLQLSGGQYLVVAPQGEPAVQIRVADSGWPKDEPRLSRTPSLTLENTTDREQIVFLERTAWSDQWVTAAEATSLQLFRDLFARETLRPGEQVTVGNLTIVFAELRDPARLRILRNAVDFEQGALVKTADDVTLAVFTRPLAAVRTILLVQHELANPLHDLIPIQMKAAIHSGSCIAVNIDERLDYFGPTVNFARRMQNVSGSGVVMISSAVRDDPDVARYLGEVADLVQIESFMAVLKGFDTEGFDLWQFRLSQTDGLKRTGPPAP
jgi:hypothetical protein